MDEKGVVSLSFSSKEFALECFSESKRVISVEDTDDGFVVTLLDSPEWWDVWCKDVSDPDSLGSKIKAMESE